MYRYALILEDHLALEQHEEPLLGEAGGAQQQRDHERVLEERDHGAEELSLWQRHLHCMMQHPKKTLSCLSRMLFTSFWIVTKLRQ